MLPHSHIHLNDIKTTLDASLLRLEHFYYVFINKNIILERYLDEFSTLIAKYKINLNL